MTGLVEAFDRIGGYLERRLPLTHAPGAALAVTDRDDVLGVVVRGFADVASSSPILPETRFQIGSISKSFAAIVALQEAEAGRLDLHAPVTELLPWLDLRQPYGPITPHHLLSHTSGLIQGTEDAPGALGAVGRLRELDPGFAPGDRFWYSNDGYKLLGLILERVTGSRIQDLIRDRILRPLGMTSTEAVITNATRIDLATGYSPLHDDRPARLTHPLVPAQWIVSNSADGSIVSNVVDMCAYARMMLAGGVGPEGPLLSPESFATLTRPVIEDPETPGFGYAYGLLVGEQDGRRRIRHSGGMVGFTALMMVDPDDGLGSIMFLNGEGEREGTVRFALDAVRAVLRGDPLPEVSEPDDPACVPNAAEYAGTFRGGGREVRVAAEGDRLVVREGSLEAALERAGKDVFLVGHPALERFHLRFERDAEARVVSLLHGPDRLVADGAAVPGPEPHPAAWDAFPGVYRSNNPWIPVMRIVLRAGRLVRLCTSSWEEDVELPLAPLPDGSFRVGDEPWRPDRMRFEDVVDGKASRLIYDGGSWFRSFEE
jgi:CubicO group peptidase (beta-lactamase class C family)